MVTINIWLIVKWSRWFLLYIFSRCNTYFWYQELLKQREKKNDSGWGPKLTKLWETFLYFCPNLRYSFAQTETFDKISHFNEGGTHTARMRVWFSFFWGIQKCIKNPVVLKMAWFKLAWPSCIECENLICFSFVRLWEVIDVSSVFTTL